MRLKTEKLFVTTKFYNKRSMKVNLFVEFNRKSITLTANLIFAKLKL